MVKRIGFWDIVKILFLISVAIVMILPFYWVVISSFKSNSDIYGHPFSPPKSFSFDSFSRAWNNALIGHSMANSLLYSSIAVLLVVVFSAMVGYVLTILRPSRMLSLYFSIGLLVPIHAMIIPLNYIFRFFHMVNSIPGIIVAYTVSNISLSVFLFVAVMRNIPRELLDASKIDGCSNRQVFWSVVLPLSRSGVATVGTFAFINCWNDLLLGLVLLTKRNLETVNVAVSNLKASFSDDYSVLAAGITCMIVPSVIIYFIFQEQIISGMTSGAVKG